MSSFETVTDIEPSENANIHGIIAYVSPMKDSPYLDAKLCDGERKVRVVGFISNQRKRLPNDEGTMDPVALNNIKVKKSKTSDDLEVVLKSTSQVQASPKKFSKAKVALLVDTHTILSDLDKRANYDQVTVKAKVIRVELPVQVFSNLRKQDVIIADSSATTRLTCGKMPLDSYALTNRIYFLTLQFAHSAQKSISHSQRKVHHIKKLMISVMLQLMTLLMIQWLSLVPKLQLLL